MKLTSFLAFGVLLLAAAPAGAVDFSTKLTQLDGSPFKDETGKPQDVTLGSVAQIALLTQYPDEADEVAKGKLSVAESNKEKVRRYALAVRIQNAKGDLALSSDEVTLIKLLIGKSYSVLMMGQAWSLLDPASIPK